MGIWRRVKQRQKTFFPDIFHGNFPPKSCFYCYFDLQTVKHTNGTFGPPKMKRKNLWESAKISSKIQKRTSTKTSTPSSTTTAATISEYFRHYSQEPVHYLAWRLYLASNFGGNAVVIVSRDKWTSNCGEKRNSLKHRLLSKQFHPRRYLPPVKNSFKIQKNNCIDGVKNLHFLGLYYSTNGMPKCMLRHCLEAAEYLFRKLIKLPPCCTGRTT